MRGVPKKQSPKWGLHYPLGVRLNRLMDPVCSLDQLGAEFCWTRQSAYTESVLALGKFGALLAEHYGIRPRELLEALKS